MSPLRKGQDYKRNIRVRWVDTDGKRRSRAFHWHGPADQCARDLRRFGATEIQIVVVKDANR